MNDPFPLHTANETTERVQRRVRVNQASLCVAGLFRILAKKKSAKAPHADDNIRDGGRLRNQACPSSAWSSPC